MRSSSSVTVGKIARTSSLWATYSPHWTGTPISFRLSTRRTFRPRRAAYRAAVVQGVDRDEGHVAFPKVGAGALPEAGAVSDDVEDVVHDLKGDPQVQAVLADGVDVLEACAGNEADDLRARHDRQGRLPRDDVEVLLMRHGGVEGVPFLADLAFREGGARVGGQLDDLRVELAADPEGLDEQEVARDEGVLQSELLVRGHAAAAHLAAVVDIVVDQGRGVDELQGRGEVDRLRGVHAAEGPEGEVGDHRPDALAARLDHVAGDVKEEGFLGNDALADLRLDKGHLRGHAKIQG